MLALASYMSSRDKDMVKKAVKNSTSALKLGELGLTGDVDFCLRRNIYDSVPVYEKGRIKGNKY